MGDDVKEEEGCISDGVESPSFNLDVMTLKGINKISKIKMFFFFFFTHKQSTNHFH